MHEVNAVQLSSDCLYVLFCPQARYNGRHSSLNRKKDRQESNRHMQHTCKYICNGLLTWRYCFQEINEVRGQNAAVELRTFPFQRFRELQLNAQIYWFHIQVRLSVISIQVNICFIQSNNILISPVVSVAPGWSTMETFNSELCFSSDFFVQKKCWLFILDFFSGVVAVTGRWSWVFIVWYFRNDFNHVIPDAVCLDLRAMELSRVLILLPDSSLSLKVMKLG